MKYLYLILFCQDAVFAQFVGIKSQNQKEQEEDNCTKGCNNANENIDYLIPPILQNLSINTTFQSRGEQEDYFRIFTWQRIFILPPLWGMEGLPGGAAAHLQYRK